MSITGTGTTAPQAQRGLDATFVPVSDGGHAMLDHVTLWQRAALDFVGAALRRP